MTMLLVSVYQAAIVYMVVKTLMESLKACTSVLIKTIMATTPRQLTSMLNRSKLYCLRCSYSWFLDEKAQRLIEMPVGYDEATVTTHHTTLAVTIWIGMYFMSKQVIF